jgi:hypothetical protein
MTKMDGYKKWLGVREAAFFAGILSLLFGATQNGRAVPNEPAITTGSASQARDYYVRISGPLAFDAKPGVTTVDDLLVFLGYPTSGAKLQILDSDILMDPARASAPDALNLPTHGLNGATLRDGDILASRFFAPKIVNISVATPVPGWRKLVRLRARPDSRAARVGVESVVILFNFFAPVGEQPFAGQSVNTQVMLLAPSQSDRLYWLDFAPNGTLTLALNASFDAADLPGGTATRDYFVPDGCNDCHGSPGNLRPAMMNYLDTDHWFDRLENDFVSLKTTNTSLLFDAHNNDPSQASFGPAFDAIRRFNEEALLQNSAVHSGSFEAEANRTWLKLHAQSDEHFSPIQRSFPPGKGPAWQPDEAEGLDRLNRYCFRCHGSVRFSIFDRQTVVDRAGIMRQRINPSKEQAKIPGFKMPPDRDLDSGEKQALDDFLKKLR